jgi:low affinity Fe/Cu permease
LKRNSWFSRFSRNLSIYSGKAVTFFAAVLLIIVWGVSGPLFGFSDTWQLVINTSTTIVTFLMVFLIQNTQNRDTESIQIKLDEIIRALQGGNNAMMNLEELGEKELRTLKKRYEKLADIAQGELQEGQQEQDDTEAPAPRR